MGHGDELVLADANFPAASVASSTTDGLIRMDSVGVPEVLDALLKLLPLDQTDGPAYVMQVMPQHKEAGLKTPVWAEFQRILDKHEGSEFGGTVPITEIERFAFYERAKTAFCIVSTGYVAVVHAQLWALNLIQRERSLWKSHHQERCLGAGRCMKQSYMHVNTKIHNKMHNVRSVRQ